MNVRHSLAAGTDPAAGMVFSAMNGLRGVAALIVVAYHWLIQDRLHMEKGYLCVDLFFVLSGFVVAHAYEERLRDGLPFKTFLLIRMIRLYPLYIVGTALMLAVVVVSFATHRSIIGGNVDRFISIPFALLMLPTPPILSSAGAELYPLNAPAWSLFFELVINVAYALSFRLWTIRNISLAMLAIALVFATSTLAGDLSFSEGGPEWPSLHWGLLRVAYSYSAGVLVYRLWRRGIVPPRIPTALILAALPGLIVLADGTVTLLAVLVGFPLLVAFAATSQPRGIARNICDATGQASYAVYIVHQPLHAMVLAVVTKLDPDASLIAAEAMLFVLLIPIALLLDRFIDMPARRELTRRLRAAPAAL